MPGYGAKVYICYAPALCLSGRYILYPKRLCGEIPCLYYKQNLRNFRITATTGLLLPYILESKLNTTHGTD